MLGSAQWSRRNASSEAQLTGLVMDSWDDIRLWRRSVRSQLRLNRIALPSSDKEAVKYTVRDLMREHFPELRFACMGFYWPFQGEIDVRHLVCDFLALGAEAALPVVVEARQPLEFWSWRPRMKLSPGVWNIPVPSERNPVQPTVLLVPLLGFDAAGYRLGYGGGYYDRTLATFAKKPLSIGIGYELGRLETIYPQLHDIPMDAIVTESGVVLHDAQEP
jgi:5-formyltetrahydrofolate cyclo-ligase